MLFSESLTQKNWPATLFLWCWISLLLYSPSKAEPRIVKYSEIPARFDQFQDESGFLWQVNKEGSITSGETQYWPSGMKLFINDAAFVPQYATLNDESATDNGPIDLVLNGNTKGLNIERHYWFDLKRGGVRLIDVIQNPGPEREVTIQMKSAFQFPWQNLVGTSGKILSSGPQVKLDPRDSGVTVKFSVTDGRQDTVILAKEISTSEQSGGASPQVSGSSNSRELTLNYTLKIPAGGSRALVHWIFRRNIGDLDEIEEQANAFYKRRKLINSRIPNRLTYLMHNFSTESIPEGSGASPSNLELVDLNRLIKRLGIERGSLDKLYITESNQLEGTINPAASISIDDKKLSIDQIAGVKGGASKGEIPRVFLRNGQVLTGAIDTENFQLKIGDEWAVDELNIEKLNLLLLSAKTNDGSAPNRTKAFIEMRNGEVITAHGFSKPLTVVTAWGTRSLTIDQIDSFYYQSKPQSEFRLLLTDGSSIGVYVTSNQLEIEDANGNPLEVNPRSLVTLRKPGAKKSIPKSDGERWYELTDVPKNQLIDKGFLLQGNNLIAGTFVGEEPLTIIDGKSTVDIPANQIISLRKLEGESERIRFELELKNGNLVKGHLRQTSLQLGNETNSWTVPIRHLIAYRSKGGAES